MNTFKKTIVCSAALAALLMARAPTCLARGLQDDVNQASAVIERFRAMPEKGIPDAVLRDAKGLAILTVLKAGFMFSGEGGRGIVVARTSDGWSGPSAIGTGGAGFGLQIGGEVTELVLVLNTPAAVDAFAHRVNVKLGGDLSVAAGPVGRDVAADVMPIAAVYAYSRSQGLFAGASVEGAVIATRVDANDRFYGRPITAKEILSGTVRPPAGTEKLRLALGESRGTRAVSSRDRIESYDRPVPRHR